MEFFLSRDAFRKQSVITRSLKRDPVEERRAEWFLLRLRVRRWRRWRRIFPVAPRSETSRITWFIGTSVNADGLLNKNNNDFIVFGCTSVESGVEKWAGGHTTASALWSSVTEPDSWLDFTGLEIGLNGKMIKKLLVKKRWWVIWCNYWTN